jgi:hypothetical protein
MTANVRCIVKGTQIKVVAEDGEYLSTGTGNIKVSDKYVRNLSEFVISITAS